MSKAVKTTGSLWVVSALLQKYTPGVIVNSHMNGYRVAETEDEARRSFQTALTEWNPGFDIIEILCRRVPNDTLRLVLQEGAKL